MMLPPGGKLTTILLDPRMPVWGYHSSPNMWISPMIAAAKVINGKLSLTYDGGIGKLSLKIG